MRALLPGPSDAVDLVAAYAPPRDAPAPTAPPVPFVRANMISTVDGAISLNGRSGLLGGEADRRVFQVLRSWADVIVVGAGTARTEAYGPARLAADLRAARTGRGQPPVPPIAVVTGSGNLDWSSPFFTAAEARPIVLTTGPSAGRMGDRAAAVADVVVAGEDTVDPRAAFDHLRRAGHRSVLVEGGPGLNADIVRAGLLDELCLTLSPKLVAGSGPRVVAGPELMPPLDLRTVHLLEEGGFLFWRLALGGVGPARGQRPASPVPDGVPRP